jgi:hypothetical protein
MGCYSMVRKATELGIVMSFIPRQPGSVVSATCLSLMGMTSLVCLLQLQLLDIYSPAAFHWTAMG